MIDINWQPFKKPVSKRISHFTRKNPFRCPLIAALIAASTLVNPSKDTAAEAYIGGTVETSADALIDLENPSESQIQAAALVSVNASIFTDNLEIALLVSAGYSNSKTEFDFQIDELTFLWYPQEFLRVKTGRFVYRPGTAEFFSATDLFSGFDIEALVYQRESALFPPRDLFQLSVFPGDFYIHTSFSPFLPGWPVPEPNSPWFPDHLFPNSIAISFPSDQTLILNGIEIVSEEDEPFTFESVSIMAEAGYSFPGADLSLLYFRGWDPEFSADVSVSFPTGLYDGYIIRLNETRSVIRVVGLNFSSSIDAFRFWIDTSYSFDKMLQTNKVSVSGLSSSLAQAGYLRYTPGVSYEFSGLNITVVFEYKGDAIFQDEDTDLQRPLFSRLAAAIVRMSFFDSRFVPTLAALFSIEDKSLAILSKIDYRHTDAVGLSIHAPFFFGADDTEFGQFADNYLIALRLTAYF